MTCFYDGYSQLACFQCQVMLHLSRNENIRPGSAGIRHCIAASAAQHGYPAYDFIPGAGNAKGSMQLGLNACGKRLQGAGGNVAYSAHISRRQGNGILQPQGCGQTVVDPSRSRVQIGMGCKKAEAAR